MNPFSYDTISLTFKGFGKAIIGIDIDVNISVDTRPIRQGYASGNISGAVEGVFNTDAQISATSNGSIGLSGEAIVGVGVTGSEGGVSDQNGVSLIVKDGVPINYSAVIPPAGEPSLAIFGGTTIDTKSKNGFASSQTWGVGYGAGFIDASGDLISAKDWIFKGSGEDIKYQFPFVNDGFFDELKNKFDDIFFDKNN